MWGPTCPFILAYLLLMTIFCLYPFQSRKFHYRHHNTSQVQSTKTSMIQYCYLRLNHWKSPLLFHPMSLRAYFTSNLMASNLSKQTYRTFALYWSISKEALAHALLGQQSLYLFTESHLVQFSFLYWYSKKLILARRVWTYHMDNDNLRNVYQG